MFYRNNGVTDKQFLTYLNGAVKDGIFTSKYVNSNFLVDDPNGKPTKEQWDIIQNMRSYGADSSKYKGNSVGIYGLGSTGSNNGTYSTNSVADAYNKLIKSI